MQAQCQAAPIKSSPPVLTLQTWQVHPTQAGVEVAPSQPKVRGSGRTPGLEEPVQQSRVGAKDCSIRKGTERLRKGTKTPAPIPHNPQAAGKDRRQADGPAGRVSSLADRGQGLPTSPTAPLRDLSQTRPCRWEIWVALRA